MEHKLMELSIAASEARTDTKFAQLIGKIDALAVSVANVSTNVGALDAKITSVDTHARSAKGIIIATVIAAALSVVGLTYAAVAIFEGAGAQTASAYQAGASAVEAKKNDNAQGSSGTRKDEAVHSGTRGGSS
jgi:hypothetical protein